MKRIISILTAILICIGIIASLPTLTLGADSSVSFRREINNESPAWIVHIDTWLYPDPAKIIELIPKDIRPYVIFNLSMSVNGYDSEDGYGVVEYAYETCKSWLRTCAEYGVWATVQPASGGPCHFEDYSELEEYEGTLYREFFEDYPNFLGFNYCEQFWGYGKEGITSTVEERYLHLANLLKITNEYGGYLFVSWCGNQWSPSINPIAMLERVPEWREACELYSQNYILCEKYTQHSYISDMESIVLGLYLSDYCGQWGVRYDESGWTSGSSSDDYTMSTGLAVEFERMLLNGACVIDGPELVPTDDFKAVSSSVDEDGWVSRNWETFTVFTNVAQDLIRKVIDGTIRIPTKEEVINRTKVIIVDDIDSGTDDEKYSIPKTLTEGLYRADGDGNLKENTSFYKSSGRYATIPMTYELSDDSSAWLIDNIIYKSEYNEKFGSIEEKISYFNELYPELYTGDLYVGNYENGWVAYNPYKEKREASAKVALLYNSCENMELTFTRYASAVIKEQSDKISVYINNYDDNNVLSARTNTITITGCSSEPTYTYTDRGTMQKASAVSSSYENGTFTLTIKHNGPVDIVINCCGTNVKDTVANTDTPLNAPASPSIYTGICQYEGEFFDYIGAAVTKNGARSNIRNYTGQGYISLGTDSGVKVRDEITAYESGKYTLTLRYTATDSPSDIAIYVNGRSAGSLSLSETGSLDEWATAEKEISLSRGSNTVEFRTKSNSGSEIYLDNFTIEANSVKSSGTDENASPIVLSDTTWIIIGLSAVIVIAVVVIIITVKKK